MNEERSFETNAIRIQTKRSLHKEHSVPVFETSSFVFDSAEEARAVFAEEKKGNIYSRFSNPNNDELVEKLCLLEGAEDGIATASGMAAVFLGFFAFLNPGDHILSNRNIFGSTHALITQIFSKWGISHTYVNSDRRMDWENHILPTTKILYTETPSNPGLDITDIQMLGKLADKYGSYFIVDNSFATPYLQAPIKYGADLVVHSTTKFIDGQGRTIGGVIIGKKKYVQEIRKVSNVIGPAMSPYTAWILSKSLETLSVRMDRHCENATELARYLEDQSEIEWVKYPFLPSHPQFKLAKKQMKQGGGLVSFELHGGMERAMRFIDQLQILSVSSNLGDSRSIITHPATTTHAKLTPEERKASGITDGMLRVSVGLENLNDIIGDVRQAITKTAKAGIR